MNQAASHAAADRRARDRSLAMQHGAKYYASEARHAVELLGLKQLWTAWLLDAAAQLQEAAAAYSLEDRQTRGVE